MTAEVVFLDTETTGLDPDRHEIWEVGVIVGDQECLWQLPVDLSRADPIALNIGRFHERRWARGTTGFIPSEKRLDYVVHPDRMDEWCEMFVRLTRGRHLCGAVISFDAERLWKLLRAHGQCPMWHYHLIDCEALAAGWLAGHAEPHIMKDGTKVPFSPVAKPPWDSENLSRAVGVDPSLIDRHTALGDARWAKAIFEAVMGADG